MNKKYQKTIPSIDNASERKFGGLDDMLPEKKKRLYKQPGYRVHARYDGLWKGFTLIELLVVVLIIGILAAVVLPQYQVAVAKSRFASMIPIVRALADAQEVYHMENGKYAATFEELAVRPPGGGTIDDSNPARVQYRDFYCRLFGDNVYCHHHRGGGYYRQNLSYASIRPNEQFCVVYGGYQELTRKVCRSYGGTQTTVGVAEAWTMP